MKASCNGDVVVVDLLLAAGADVDLQDNNERTAAQIAQERGHYAITELIEKAARGE